MTARGEGARLRIDGGEVADASVVVGVAATGGVDCMYPEWYPGRCNLALDGRPFN
jgi:hypothetical protein